MASCLPSLRSATHFFASPRTKPSHQRQHEYNKHYTLSRDPSLNLREAIDGRSSEKSFDHDLDGNRSSSSEAKHLSSGQVDPADGAQRGVRNNGKKREFSVLSIESLMKKTQDLLARNNSLASLISLFAPADAAATALEAQHLVDVEKEGSTLDVATANCDISGSTAVDRSSSSLRHKRNVSDLRSKFAQVDAISRRTTKRVSGVMSMGGESAWVTDDEDE
ncbi:hypothetical protein LTR62_007964 [Meristemomyces frigidus]|uniref:Uncharacterized protein n=1 Tax=Meristemomyces frigidus TaxID=1508187 RepID=A0AAN7TMZ5_9PEZI|nr:hypothetical protein LTR62_007964 [Meristemomyces frigidus]